MELIKRKILLESLISRQPDISYGTMTADTIYLDVFLTQSIDDLGMFTDMPYIMSTGTTNTLTLPIFNDDLRVDGRDVSYYYNYGNRVTGFTDSKLSEYKTYNRLSPYKKDFDLEQVTYVNFSGETIYGKMRVTAPSDPINPDTSIVTYVDKANGLDPNIGTPSQANGLRYQTYPLTGDNRISNFYNISGLASIINPDNPEQIDTTVSYIGEGWNNENTSLSAIVKEEIFLSIVSPPEVQTDVFIDRGVTSAIEYHLKLSEIESVEHLTRYGNGYYNVTNNNLK